MNNTKQLIVIASALALGLAPAALGGDITDSAGDRAYIQSQPERTNAPVPVSVETPALDPSWAGDHAVVQVDVDTSGEPTHVEVISATDVNLARSVRNAVSDWRFRPAVSNGVAVPARVILPVFVAG